MKSHKNITDTHETLQRLNGYFATQQSSKTVPPLTLVEPPAASNAT